MEIQNAVIKPYETQKIITLSPSQRGLVRVKHGGASSPETFYAHAEIAEKRPICVIEIWKTATTDYSKHDRFVLQWQRKIDVWRYFIVKPTTLTTLKIETKETKHRQTYPRSIDFNIVAAADQNETERTLISRLVTTTENVALFRASVPLPQFEKPYGEITLVNTSTLSGFTMPLPQPTATALDNNIIIKI